MSHPLKKLGASEVEGYVMKPFVCLGEGDNY